MNNQTDLLSISNIDDCIDRAIKFLDREQLPDGEIKTYIARGCDPSLEYRFDSTPFTTSLVLYCLSFSNHPHVNQIRDKGLNFLAQEMESFGTWRFWSKKNSNRRLIPPDMDDTCCISFLLEKYRKTPTNKELILANCNSQGHFYTWFLPKFKTLLLKPQLWYQLMLETPVRFMFWRNTEAEADDIDGGVNANVLLYLGERKETKKAIDYLIDIALNNKEASCDKWYLTKFPFYYLLSRAYFNKITSLGVVQSKVIESLENMETELLMNSLDASLTACTILNFNSSSKLLPKIVTKLIKQQQKDGSWDRIALYYGGPEKYYGWGSKELTTGFCLEALTRYKMLIN